MDTQAKATRLPDCLALVLLLGAAGCGSHGTAPPAADAGGRGAAPHPAIAFIMAGALDDDQKLSFFARFDRPSFSLLAETAFTHPDPRVRLRAEELMDAVLWNWYPDLASRDERRHEAREILIDLVRRPHPRVREGALESARRLYDDTTVETALSEAVRAGVEDGDADVRLAAVRLAIVLHEGHAGGCVREPKKTAFTLRTLQTLLERKLSVEPDPRVRAGIVSALSRCPSASTLSAIRDYLAAADRRPEAAALARPVWALFCPPDAAGLSMDDAVWGRLCSFLSGPETAGAVARRNAVSILLEVADAANRDLREDAEAVARVLSWLETDGHVGEEDMHRILRHWRVMEPDRVVHQPEAFLYRSSLADLVGGLRLTLDQLKKERASPDRKE